MSSPDNKDVFKHSVELRGSGSEFNDFVRSLLQEENRDLNVLNFRDFIVVKEDNESWYADVGLSSREENSTYGLDVVVNLAAHLPKLVDELTYIDPLKQDVVDAEGNDKEKKKKQLIVVFKEGIPRKTVKSVLSAFERMHGPGMGGCLIRVPESTANDEDESVAVRIERQQSSVGTLGATTPSVEGNSPLLKASGAPSSSPTPGASRSPKLRAAGAPPSRWGGHDASTVGTVASTLHFEGDEPLVVQREREAALEISRYAAKGDKAARRQPQARSSGDTNALDEANGDDATRFSYSKQFLDNQARVHHKAAMDDFRAEMKDYTGRLNEKLMVLEGRIEPPPVQRTVAEIREEERLARLDALAKKRQAVAARHEALAARKMEWQESFL